MAARGMRTLEERTFGKNQLGETLSFRLSSDVVSSILPWIWVPAEVRLPQHSNRWRSLWLSGLGLK